MTFLDVMVACPDRETAMAIARSVVSERLAACANVGAEISSVYRWKGAVEEATETPVFLKTRADLFGQLSARVREQHPYETPCIIATEIAAIDAEYAVWLESETA